MSSKSQTKSSELVGRREIVKWFSL